MDIGFGFSENCELSFLEFNVLVSLADVDDCRVCIFVRGMIWRMWMRWFIIFFDVVVVLS